MSKLKNIEELDELFKEGLEQLEVPAPPEVWASVSGASSGQAVSALSKLSSYFSSITNIVKVALFVGGISTAGILLYNANNGSEQSGTENTQTSELVDNESLDASEQLNAELEDFNDEANIEEPQTEEIRDNQNTDNNLSGQVEPIKRSEGEDELLVKADNDPVSNEPNPRSAVSIHSMSNQCCKGETRTFNSGTTEGNWYVNGVLVKSNSVVMSHRFTKGGSNTVSFRSASGVSEFGMQVKDVDLNIVVKDLENGQYNLSLDNDTKVVRWLINGVEMSRAQSFQPILALGKNLIAVEASSGECTFFSEQTVDIKPKGSFSSPDIFTPNNDNENETYFVDIKNYEFFALTIFDPINNEVVFQTTDPKMEWNGKVRNTGKECPNGLYAVKVNYKLNGEQLVTKNIKLTLKRD